MTLLHDPIEPEEFGEIITHYRAKCHHCVWYGANHRDPQEARLDLIDHLADSDARPTQRRQAGARAILATMREDHGGR